MAAHVQYTLAILRKTKLHAASFLSSFLNCFSRTLNCKNGSMALHSPQLSLRLVSKLTVDASFYLYVFNNIKEIH